MTKLQTALFLGAFLTAGIQGIASAADAATPTPSAQTQNKGDTTGPTLPQGPDRPAAAAGTQSNEAGGSSRTDQSNHVDPHALPSDRPASAKKENGGPPQNAKDDEDYLAKIKKCESMSNPGSQRNCTDKVKKEHGQM